MYIEDKLDRDYLEITKGLAILQYLADDAKRMGYCVINNASLTRFFPEQVKAYFTTCRCYKKNTFGKMPSSVKINLYSSTLFGMEKLAACRQSKCNTGSHQATEAPIQNSVSPILGFHQSPGFDIVTNNFTYLWLGFKGKITSLLVFERHNLFKQV